MSARPDRLRILVTGATGYIGGRLVRQLLAEGHEVRAMARDVRRLAALWDAGATCVEADVLDAASLTSAVAEIDVAYYLVHLYVSKNGDSFVGKAAARSLCFGCAKPDTE